MSTQYLAESLLQACIMIKEVQLAAVSGDQPLSKLDGCE